MAKNRHSLALYEVIGERAAAARAAMLEQRAAASAAPPAPRAAPQPPTPVPEPIREPADTGPIAGMQPTARTVRLPVGYLWVSAAVVAGLMVIAYSAGHSLGRRSAFADASPARPTVADPTIRETDSGRTQGPGELAGVGMSPRSTSVDPAQRAQPTSPTQQTRTTPDERRLDRDTRIVGLNYITVERFEPEEAWGVRDFLKDHGIETLILPDSTNRALLRVVTAEGFQGWRTNAAAQELDRTLERLGREWRSRHRGSKDFSKRLAARYDG